MHDAFASSDLETLPGDWSVPYSQIRRWREGEVFYVFDGELKKHYVDPSDPSPEEFAYYYRLWEYYHHWGLPHGSGWAEELPWLLDFYKEFDSVFHAIEVYRTKRRKA